MGYTKNYKQFKWSKMSLTGNINTIDLADLLQLLCNDQKTGILKITNEKNEVKIIIKDGSIIYATSSQKEFRLGTLMVNEGIITYKQLMDAIAESKKQNLAIGKFLVIKKHITTDILKQFSNKQVEEILYNIFLWNEGNFEYKDQAHNFDEMIVAPFNTMNIILEAARRIDEMSIFKKKINNEKMVFNITEKILDNEGIILQLNEWRMLSFVDGTCSVEGIIKKSGFDKYSVYRILYSLISYGLVEECAAGQVEEKDTVNFSAIICEYYNILQTVRSCFI
ncbi:DUF4388 domain-containing protein [Desulfosarcina sp. BuS5]|uniref:DUF4388 domain-containing protein n=2 Tax=Desulfosarcina sp. BuS5 TaxID=933262 RepID=UPI0009FEA82E|nr:DUF4388 domain-containing protein [Desulfosarcina sp. BuS5]